MSELEQKLAYGIGDADMGRTTTFREIAEGRLKARKIGRRTVILRKDAEAYLNALPPAHPRVTGAR
jgi:hypothetical protein